jgi:hypothetical protein
MGWKTVKRPKPQLNVPVGVGWDAEGQRPIIPRYDLRMPDGRQLFYKGSLDISKQPENAVWHTSDALFVAAGIEEFTLLGPLLEVALGYRRKDPSWKEITSVKTLFFGPDISAMMLLPKEAWYTHGFEGNEDSHTYHVWQLPQAWERALWDERGERRS